MMRRLSFILIPPSFVAIQQVHVQYYSVNYDAHTVAAMATAFGTEAMAGSYYWEQVDDVLKHYNAAEVAMTGIFASEFSEHKAFSDPGIWNNNTENYHYRRIYRTVSGKIIPKIWVVAKLMLRSPQATIYWGSYLMKIRDETKSLCMQLGSVVTNGTLGFSDTVFLEINRNITPLLKLLEMGDIDWQHMLDGLANMPGGFTKENLQRDIDNLYNMGVGLASAGIKNTGDTLLQTSSPHGLVGGRTSKTIDLHDHYGALFRQAEHDLGGLPIDMVGGEGGVAGLLGLSDYDLISWITDYLGETAGNYYTQRWYTGRRGQGGVALYDYYPSTDDNSISNGGEQTHFGTTDPGFCLNASQREQVLANPERYAGWSRSRVQQLDSQNDGYTYNINYWQNGYIISRGGKQVKKAYAYETHVKKSWNREEIIYEEVFDSYSMDLSTFKVQLNARLSEFNDNREGCTYYIASDVQNHCQAADATKLQGCENVTISTTCLDGITLSQGTTQYKCRRRGKFLSTHLKGCAMQTTVTENELDLSESDAMLQETEKQAAVLQSQINALENGSAGLLRKVVEASVEGMAVYRQQCNTNKTQIDCLRSELSEWQKKQQEYTGTKTKAADDNDAATDDYYHTPTIMQNCKTAYNLSWQDGGARNGYTHIRKATMPNINGVITFRATISMTCKPRYFLGIKIHHAIIQVGWEPTTEYADTYVANMLTFDPNLPGTKKTKLVNDRIAGIVREHPSCKITAEYARTPLLEETPTGEACHPLWLNDWLEAAWEVDSRITKIYADLASLEKMMHYKRNIIDVLEDVLLELDMDEGCRLALVKERHERWAENARNLRNGNGRNGKDSGKEVRP